DANIGRILDRIEALGLRENTIIWFLSDNGFSTGHHGVWGKGNATWPINMLDNSVLVPAIASQPGTIAEGVVKSELVSGYDFAHTLLEQVHLSMPNAADLPGRSFAHLLGGEGSDDRDYLVVHDEYGPVRMIRTDRWKYVHRYPFGPHELHDMVADPFERINLVDVPDYAATVHELRNRLDQWFVSHVDPE